MKTSRDILSALRDRRGAEAHLAGDALDDVVADLEQLAKIERSLDVAITRLEHLPTRDDDALVNREAL